MPAAGCFTRVDHAKPGVAPPRRIGFITRLQTRAGPANLDLEALVCNVKRDEAHNRFLHGVKFVDVEPLALRGYIESARRRREPDLSR